MPWRALACCTDLERLHLEDNRLRDMGEYGRPTADDNNVVFSSRKSRAVVEDNIGSCVSLMNVHFERNKITQIHFAVVPHPTMCAYVHAYVRPYVQLCVRACTCVRVLQAKQDDTAPLYLGACMHVCACARACVRVSTRACGRAHACTLAFVRVCVRACVRACVHIERNKMT